MAGSGIIYNIRRKMQVIAARTLKKEWLNSLYTKVLCGYYPNLRNPQTFNEKIQWLKLYSYSKNDLVSAMSDKIEIRRIIEEMGIDVKMPFVYFCSENANDIPFDELPNKFVLKCNHGCAYNIVCDDKSNFDGKKAKKKIKRWLKEDFGLFNLEPHYSKIKRRVFAEEYLGDELTDYKFFCFNGTPRFLYVSRDLVHDSKAKMSYFDLDWNKLPLVRDDYASLDDAKRPKCFEKLVQLCRDLSKPFPFVRVDFYVINDEPVLSEMTFSPSAGMMPVNPRRFDAEWGRLLDISGAMDDAK